MTFTQAGNSYLCTGTLLADRNGTRTPYFLTANHCLDTNSAAASLNTFWFYQRTSCGGGAVTTPRQLTRGATLLATSSNADFTFLRLNESAPSDASFSGWHSGTFSSGTSIAGVHHPGGDPKKISLGRLNGVADKFRPVSGSGTHLSVTWSQGLTEGGSSGSGLFTDDGNRYLIGVLTGGQSFCTGSSVWYGRFSLIYPQITTWLEASAATSRIISLSGNLAFGGVQVATTSSRTLTIANTGNASLTVASIIYPSGFSGNWSGGTIPAGGSQAVTVVFAPTAAGSYGGTLTVSANQTSGTNNISASGAGTFVPQTAPGAPSVEINPDCSVTLRWTVATGSVLDYAIVAQVNGAPAGVFSVGLATSLRSGPLNPATYQVYVRALFANGSTLSGAPTTWSHTCGGSSAGLPGPPAWPSQGAVVVNGSSITLTWLAGSGATSYDLDAVVQATGQAIPLSVGSTALTVNGVPPGNYLMRVRSRNAQGVSAFTTSQLVIVGAVLGIGDLQVTLTWDQSTDIDLHVIEPDGTHVYYAARTGRTARLDRDNSSGFGPEDIFVGSSQAAAGNYQVYIVHFSGNTATNETIRITLRPGTAQQQVVLLPRSTPGSAPGVGYNVAQVNVLANTITEASGTRSAAFDMTRELTDDQPAAAAAKGRQ